MANWSASKVFGLRAYSFLSDIWFLYSNSLWRIWLIFSLHTRCRITTNVNKPNENKLERYIEACKNSKQMKLKKFSTTIILSQFVWQCSFFPISEILSFPHTKVFESSSQKTLATDRHQIAVKFDGRIKAQKYFAENQLTCWSLLACVRKLTNEPLGRH